METLTIDVTADDIERARRERYARPQYACCPIAQALRRQFPDEYIAVEYHIARVGDVVWKLPHRAEDFVIDFDFSNDAKPATFVVKRSHN